MKSTRVQVPLYIESTCTDVQLYVKYDTSVLLRNGNQDVAESSEISVQDRQESATDAERTGEAAEISEISIQDRHKRTRQKR